MLRYEEHWFLMPLLDSNKNYLIEHNPEDLHKTHSLLISLTSNAYIIIIPVFQTTRKKIIIIIIMIIKV